MDWMGWGSRVEERRLSTTTETTESGLEARRQIHDELFRTAERKSIQAKLNALLKPILERRAGIEPANTGFADLRVSRFATGA